jgi:hypothetical protein
MNGVGWSMQQLQQQLLLLLSEPHCVAQAAARLTTAPSQWQAATTASAHAPAHTLGSTHSPPGAAQGVLCPFQREQVFKYDLASSSSAAAVAAAVSGPLSAAVQSAVQSVVHVGAVTAAPGSAAVGAC